MTDDSVTAVPVAPAAAPSVELRPDSADAREHEDASGVPGDASVPVRRPDGTFLPGAQWSGNSKGRAKGVKNRITLERLLVEEKLRDKLGFRAEDLLQRAIEMAMEGNDKIMRTLLDKLLATPKNTEDDAGQDRSVQITINDLSGVAKPVSVNKGNQTLRVGAIDAETE